MKQSHLPGNIAPSAGPTDSSFKLILAESMLSGLPALLEREIRERHEGVVYLLGKADSASTLAVAAIHPAARTTRGSFNVDSVELAKVVRTAEDNALQVVGQLHTHPRMAFHSSGDVDGARIRYPGYVSIVVPDFGRDLPSLSAAVIFICDLEFAFRELYQDQMRVVPAHFE